MNTTATTPKAAILKQCRYCMNTDAFRGCGSDICKLNGSSLSNIKKIKSHCQDCVGATTSSKAVIECDGKLISGEVCSLHPYRCGHNPKLKGKRGNNGTRYLFAFKNRLREQTL